MKLARISCWGGMIVLAGLMAGIILGLSPGRCFAAPWVYFDVRTQLGQHTAQITTVGSVIQLNLYALVLNGNGNAVDDTFVASSGGIVSSAAGVQGNLAFNPGGGIGAWPAGVDVGLSQAGQQMLSLDADADIDLGNRQYTGVLATSFFIVSATAGVPLGTMDGTETIGGAEYKRILLASGIQFTVTDLGNQGPTTITYLPRAWGGSQKVYSDSVYKTLNGGTLADVGMGDGVTVSYVVPEPVTLALLAIGGLVVVARRRRTQ